MLTARPRRRATFCVVRKVCVRRASLLGRAVSIAISAAVVGVGLGACGGAAKPSGRSGPTARQAHRALQPQPVCRPAARAVLARTAHVSLGTTRAVAGSGNNAE